MKYMEFREQLCDVCHKMWQLGWVAANDGNVTVKLPDGSLYSPPLDDMSPPLERDLLEHLRAGGEVPL